MEINSIAGIPGTQPAGVLEGVKDNNAQIRESNTRETVSETNEQNRITEENKGVNVDVIA